MSVPIISSVIGALGSVLNGVFGFLGQSSSNSKNEKLMRLQASLNERMMDKQNQWNAMFWNDVNEYNTPTAQRQRLEEAGLNPIFSGLDGTGNASAMQSASFNAPQAIPYQNDLGLLGNGLGQAAKTFAEIQLMNAQSKKLDADTEGQNLQNEITNASKGDLIRYNSVVVTATQNGADLSKKQIDSLQKGMEEADARIKTMNEQLTIQRDEVEIKRELKDMQIGLAEFNKWIETQKFDRDTEFMIKELAIKSAVASAQVMVSNSTAKNLDARTELSVQEKDFNDLTYFLRFKATETGVLMQLNDLNYGRIRNGLTLVQAKLSDVDLDVQSNGVNKFIRTYVKPVTESISDLMP